MRVVKIFAAVCVIFSLTISAMAHNGATGIVMERMNGMSAIAKSMKALVAMTRSGEVDRARVAELAAIIQSYAGQKMLSQFPAGSLQKASEASPEIWEDWPRFEALALRLEALAKGIGGSAAHDGPDRALSFGTNDPLPDEASLASMPLEVLLDHTAKTCSSCHKAFRIEK